MNHAGESWQLCVLTRTWRTVTSPLRVFSVAGTTGGGRELSPVHRLVLGRLRCVVAVTCWGDPRQDAQRRQ